MSMHVVTLLENTACSQELSCEHGLSLYIEAADLKILFDAGQSGAFADNAQKLGVDLSKVDIAILSHGHYDHGGGLARFLELNVTAPVYVHKDAFIPHYNGSEKYIGLDQALLNSGRLVFVEDTVQLAPGITLYGGSIPLPYPIDPAGLTMLEKGQYLPEDFRHEQYLIIEEMGKKVCFSGCSHRGILNIAGHFCPDVLVGGFHFMNLTAEKDALRLTAAARKLLEYPTVYYTGHCTGAAAFDFMKPIMGDRLNALTTGTVMEI